MMSLLALLMGAVISWWVIQYWNQPLDMGLVAQESTQTIHHSGFSDEDQRQAIIQYAYDLWWLDFVLMIECENWNWSIKAKWDWWHAYGLCQMNDRWHKIPQEYFTSWEYQVEYCYKKWSTGTKFYGPDRKVKGQTCKNYVKNRFIIS